MKPEIDILLPYWGSFEMLKEAVESVFAQTENNWHLIVSDDCYPGKEAREYFAKISDPRVTYIRHEKNIGITNNFNFCLDQAKAEFCVLMGCDDIMKPNFIKRALKKIGDVDFYQPMVEVIDEKSQVYKPLADKIKNLIRLPKGIQSGEKLAISLSKGNWLYFPSIVWRTETIKKYGFSDEFSITQDLILHFNIITNGGKLYVDDATTFQYRRHKESLSNSKSKKDTRFNEENATYEKYAKIFTDLGWKKAARAAKIHITSRINQIIF